MPSVAFDDLRDHLRTHMGFLDASAASYDNGNQAEALRLATSLRVLLHDTPKSHSILGQMNLKDQLGFIDSIPPELAVIYEDDARHMMSPGALSVIQLSSDGVKIMPLAAAGIPLDSTFTKPFELWWKRQVILRDSQNAGYSRRNLVLWLANKDGGAHVDVLPEEYRRISREGMPGVTIGPDQTPFLDSPVPPAIRQISEEVRGSIRHQLPHLVN